MHLGYSPCFDLNSFHYMHTSEEDLEEAQSSVETARQELKKACKSVRSKSWLEHDSTQDLNATPLPDILWS